MAEEVKHNKPGAIWLFDYNSLLDMDDCPKYIVSLSERDINIIWQATINIDRIRSRVFTDVNRNLYTIADLDQWGVFKSWVSDMNVNMGDFMTCTTALDSIAESLALLAAKDCCQPTIGGGSAGAGLDEAPASTISSSEEAQEGPPPDGFESWEEYFSYKCDMAHYILTQMTGDIATSLVIAAGTAGVAAVAAGLLAALATPIGWAVLLGLALLVIQWFVLGAEASALTSFLGDNENDLICALFNGDDTAGSIGNWGTAIDTLVPAYSLISAYGVIAEYVAANMLKTIATVDSINRLYVKVAYAIPTGNNCDDCNPLGPILYTCIYPEIPDFNDDGYMILVAENAGGDYFLAYGFDGSKNYDITLESGSYTSPSAVPSFMTAEKYPDATFCGLGSGAGWDSITTSFPSSTWVSPGTIQLRSGTPFSARFTPFD